MKIIAIRHGETDWNAEGRIQGASDIPLNKKGREQARKTADIIQSYKIDVIISSKLKRAVETAEIIAGKLNVSCVVSYEMLHERNFGDYEGMSYENVPLQCLRSYHKNLVTPNGETIREAFIRVSDCLDNILKIYSGKNILFVVHGHVLRVMQWYFNGIPETEEDETIYRIENCAIYEFEM